MSKVSLTKEVPASQEDFYHVITDYERYPEFIPEIKKAVIVSKKPQRVEFTLDLIKTFHYILEFKEDPPSGLSWKLVKSDLFKKNSGGWKLKKKNGLLFVTYFLNVEFGFLAPSFIVNQMVKKDLPKMVEKFSERVSSLT